MSTAVLIVSLLVACVSFATGAWGAWLWWGFAAQDRYWVAIRATQLGALLLAVLAGVVWATGADGVPWLFWLYCLLPVAISMIAEQLRIVAAEQVLERRGLDGAADVGRLDEAGQRGVVREIVRREVGIMTVSAFVICFLALRVTVERSGI
jgi:hypothetical protein